jgi:hypothetical protein
LHFYFYRAVFKLENIEKELNELNKRIINIAPAEIIHGKNEIYKRAIEIIKDAKGIIRATSFVKKDKAPKDYFLAIAKKLKNSKEQGKHIEYRVVMSKVKEPKRRYEIFIQYNVIDLFKQGYVDIIWGLDILIVDDRHLLIAFPELSVDKSLKRGILFFNKPELVSSIREWYDSYLWNRAEK